MVFGPYRVIRSLGAGGQGSVFEVEHMGLRRVRALKVLDPNHPAVRLHTECWVLGALEHPNIVQILDIGTAEDGRPFIVMERLVGETLASKLEREGCLETSRAIA